MIDDTPKDDDIQVVGYVLKRKPFFEFRIRAFKTETGSHARKIAYGKNTPMSVGDLRDCAALLLDIAEQQEASNE